MRIQTTLTPAQIEFAESIRSQFGLRNIGEALVFGFLNFWKEVKDNSYIPENIDLKKSNEEYEANLNKSSLPNDIKMAAISSYKNLKSKYEV